MLFRKIKIKINHRPPPPLRLQVNWSVPNINYCREDLAIIMPLSYFHIYTPHPRTLNRWSPNKESILFVKQKDVSYLPLYELYGFFFFTATHKSTMSVPSVDWQSSKNLVESHLYLFQNEIETDVEFLVGGENKETIRAHRIILACRSPMFHAMFYGAMREKETVIPLIDIEPDSLKVFLT